MGYREVGLMQVVEVLRRWQAGESVRAIARATGLARNSVRKYLRAAERLGLGPHGPAPNDEQVLRLVRLSSSAAPARAAPQVAVLDAHRELIAGWLSKEHLQLTRVAELLAQQGVPVTYTTLRRFARAQGLTAAPHDTVRMADSPPGAVAEFDFGRLGLLPDAETGTRHVVWALNLVLVYSRHQFVWPLIQQTLAEVIAGLEAAWRFLGGIPRRLVLDNFPAAVAGPDALNPVPTRGFLEYSQARGFLIDPARVRHPKDKPHTERNVQYVRERLWKGGSFTDLADLRAQAQQWCREVAGLRVHGTTRQVPRVVFEDDERAHLLPYDGVPYDVPVWGEVRVHPDHHVSFQYALYSVPYDRCPPGTRLEVRADRDLVRLYQRGALVKTHPRQARGHRHTDEADYPPERSMYALRAPDRVVRAAAQQGPCIGLFAERLLAGDFPWAKLRQGQKLLRLAERYTAPRLEAACARALSVNLIDVTRVERMLQAALDQEPLPGEPPPARAAVVPSARFARRRHELRSSLPPQPQFRSRGDVAMTTLGAPLPSLPIFPIDSDLLRLLKRLKLGALAPTLPERLTLARAQQLDYAAFLTLLLADEVQRRDHLSLERRLAQAGFEDHVTLEEFDWAAPIQLDRRLLQEVATLGFLTRRQHVLLVGPVGVGKTFLAQAIGVAAVRAGHPVLFTRADALFKDLAQARVDHSYERAFRHYLAPELLIIDDFGLRRLSAQQSADLYELIIERQRRASFLFTSNRSVDEWLGLFDDPILGNSALDRLAHGAYQLIIEGPSYRAKLAPQIPHED